MRGRRWAWTGWGAAHCPECGASFRGHIYILEQELKELRKEQVGFQQVNLCFSHSATGSIKSGIWEYITRQTEYCEKKKVIIRMYI